MISGSHKPILHHFHFFLATKPTMRILQPAMTEQPIPDSPFGAASAHDPFQAAKASAMKAAEELRAAATQKANELRSAAETKATQFRATAEQKAADLRDKADEYRDYAGQAFTDAKGRCADLRTEAENFAREKPMQAILTAFGVGLFVGLLLRK
jgi:ElaB/YqjD/DUF883 family membrane-anchored ribosome-binding protein